MDAWPCTSKLRPASVLKASGVDTSNSKISDADVPTASRAPSARSASALTYGAREEEKLMGLQSKSTRHSAALHTFTSNRCRMKASCSFTLPSLPPVMM